MVCSTVKLPIKDTLKEDKPPYIHRTQSRKFIKHIPCAMVLNKSNLTNWHFETLPEDRMAVVYSKVSL